MAVDPAIASKLIGQRNREAKRAFLIIYRDGIPVFRYCNASKDTMSGGHTYSAKPMEVTYPARAAKRVPLLRIMLSNVGLELKRQFNSTEGFAGVWTLDLFHAMSKAPDVVFERYLDYEIQKSPSTIKEFMIEATPHNLNNRTLVTLRFDPATTPGAMPR